MLTSLITSFILTFIWPYVFGAVSSLILFIFEHFTRPFNFSGGDNWFAKLLSPDLINVIVKIMVSAGVVLAVFILAYNLFKLFFAGISRRAESPISLCFRALFAIFLCYWIIDIVYYVFFPMFQWFLDMVHGITVNWATTGVDAMANLFSYNADFDTATNVASKIGWAFEGQNKSLLMSIIILIFTIKAFMSMIKLVTEMAERYLLINVLTISGPLVAPTIISNSTMEIFVSWTRMLIANSLVLVFNSLGMIMLHAGFITLGEHLSSGGLLSEGLLWMITYSALIKVVQKFDVYLAQLAFKIQAIGGDGRNRSALGILMMGASLAGRGSKFANRVADDGGLLAHTKYNAGGLLGFFGGRFGNDASAKLSQETIENKAALLYQTKKGSVANKMAENAKNGVGPSGRIANLYSNNLPSSSAPQSKQSFVPLDDIKSPNPYVSMASEERRTKLDELKPQFNDKDDDVAASAMSEAGKIYMANSGVFDEKASFDEPRFEEATLGMQKYREALDKSDDAATGMSIIESEQSSFETLLRRTESAEQSGLLPQGSADSVKIAHQSFVNEANTRGLMGTAVSTEMPEDGVSHRVTIQRKSDSRSQGKEEAPIGKAYDAFGREAEIKPKPSKRPNRDNGKGENK